MINATYDQLLSELIQKAGSRETKRLLVIAGLAPSTAQQIVGGTYTSIGRHVGETIMRVLAGLQKPAS